MHIYKRSYLCITLSKSCIPVGTHDLNICHIFFPFLSSSPSPPCPSIHHSRPEIQDIDGNSQCHGLANEKTEDVDDEDEELEEEDDDSLTGKSQDETASPTAEPRGAFEDEEDEEPTSLTMSFDHTRR